MPSAHSRQTQALLEDVRLQQIEFAIQNHRKRSEASYLTVNEHNIITDVDFRVTLLLDRPRSRIIGRTFWWFISKDEQSDYLFSRKCLLDTHTPQDCELRMLRAGNVPFWLRLQLSSTQMPDGKGIRLAIWDITESKTIELALKDKERGLMALLAKERHS